MFERTDPPILRIKLKKSSHHTSPLSLWSRLRNYLRFLHRSETTSTYVARLIIRHQSSQDTDWVSDEPNDESYDDGDGDDEPYGYDGYGRYGDDGDEPWCDARNARTGIFQCSAW